MKCASKKEKRSFSFFSSIFFLLGAFCLCVGCLDASESIQHSIALDTGERLIGTISPESNSEILVLKSGLWGTVSFSRSRIVSNQIFRPKENKDTLIDETVINQLPQSKSKKSSTASVDVPVNSIKDSEVSSAQSSPEEVKPELIQSFREFSAPDFWNGNFRMGYNTNAGDRHWTETVLSGVLEIQHPDTPNFYRFGGNYNYRKSENAQGETFKSTDKYETNFIFRRAFANAWFVQNSLGGRVDQRKGIDLELQDVLGIGYKYKPFDKFEIIIGGGGGVEQLDADFSVNSGKLEPIGNVFQEFSWKLFERTSFVQKFNYYWNTEAPSDYNFVLTAAIRMRLTELLGLEFSYKQDYDNFTEFGNIGDDIQWQNAVVVYF